MGPALGGAAVDLSADRRDPGLCDYLDHGQCAIRVPAEYGKRGAGLAATIFDPVAGGLTPPVHADGSGSLAGLGRRRDVASSQSLVGGAVGTPVDGADATKDRPAHRPAPWMPPLPQLVASHSAFFPPDNNETPDEEP
ncbi:MAG: hypothetical protein ACLP66_01430 [Polyangia bacterium]